MYICTVNVDQLMDCDFCEDCSCFEEVFDFGLC